MNLRKFRAAIMQVRTVDGLRLWSIKFCRSFFTHRSIFSTGMPSVEMTAEEEKYEEKIFVAARKNRANQQSTPHKSLLRTRRCFIPAIRWC